jgi:hypothetical protein
MSDFGDIFDMFSNDGKENKKSRGQTGSQDEASGNNPMSLVMNKLSKNKPLLIATVVAGTVILGGVAFFLIKYIGTNGAKGIIDTIKPFLNMPR